MRLLREALQMWADAIRAHAMGEYEPLRSLYWRLPVITWFRDRRRYP